MKRKFKRALDDITFYITVGGLLLLMNIFGPVLAMIQHIIIMCASKNKLMYLEVNGIIPALKSSVSEALDDMNNDKDFMARWLKRWLSWVKKYIEYEEWYVYHRLYE